MENSSRQWYLKSAMTATNVQGPYSIERLLQFIEQGKLKARVCISLNQGSWYPLGDLFKGRSLSVIEFESALKAISEKPLKTRSSQAGRRLKIWMAILAAVMILATICIWHLSRDTNPLPQFTAGPNEDGNDKGAQVPKMEDGQDVPAADEGQSVPADGEDVPADSKAVDGQDIPADAQNIPTDSTDGQSPVETEGDQKSPTDKAQDVSQERETAGEVIAQLDEEMLRVAVKEYYRHLDTVTEELSKRRNLKEAHDLFEKRVKTMEEFLQMQGIEVLDGQTLQNTRFENKGDERCAFFFPASLYDTYPTFLMAVDDKAMAAMEQQIADYRDRFADVIIAKKNVEEQRRTLSNTYALLTNMRRSASEKLVGNHQVLAGYKKKILDIREAVSKNQSTLVELSQKSLDLTKEIIKVKKELEPSPIPDFHPGKEWEFYQLEQKLQRLQKEKDTVVLQMSVLQQQISKQEQEISQLETNIADMERELVELNREVSDLEKQIADITPKLSGIEQELEKYRATLKLLDDLLLRKEEIGRGFNETELWWRNSYHKPRKNFLLATYVLQTFPPEYYRIKVRKNYGSGVVEVYFW